MRLLVLLRALLLIVVTFIPLRGSALPEAPPARAQHPGGSSATAVSAAAPADFWYLVRLYTRTSPQRMNSVVFDPETPGLALAGNEGGLPQRTTDHGVTWRPILDEQLGDGMLADSMVYGEQQGVFYTLDNYQLFKTINGGQSWSQLPAPAPPLQPIYQLIVQPSNPQVLYAMAGADFIRSLDGGTTWTLPAEACNCAPEARSLAIGTDQPTLYAGRAYDRGAGVARSLDQGATWTDVMTGLPTDISIIKVIVDSRDADVVYALTEQGEIYRTGNGGAQWSLFMTGLPQEPINTLTLDVSHGYRLYALSDFAIYTRDDGAPAWQQLALPPLPQWASFPYPWHLTVDPADATRLVLASEQGIVVSMPVPIITALNQASTPVGGSTFTLVVTGTGFLEDTTIQLNGIYCLTQFISSEQVATTLTTADLAFPRTLDVTVGTPGDDGGTSNSLAFTIAGPALTITRLSPDLRAAGEAAFTLEVQGTEFAPGAMLQWNGAARPTTVVSSTLLTAQISATDLATPGAVAITVLNPAPDGRTSNTRLFMVAPQASPVARRLRPESVTGPVSSFLLTDDGANIIYMGAEDLAHQENLYRFSMQGGTPQRLNAPLAPGDRLSGFQITKDQLTIVYQQYISATQQVQFYSVPVTGGAPIALNPPLGLDELTYPAYVLSDDSQRLIYQVRQSTFTPTLDRIYSVSLNGGAPTLLFAPSADDQSVQSFVISPDGARVVFTVINEFPPDKMVTIYSVAATGGQPVVIAGPFPQLNLRSFQITPDSRTIAFTHHTHEHLPPTLYTVPIEGGTPAMHFTPLPSLWGSDLYISPDSQFAVLTGGEGIFSVRLDGSAPPVRLTSVPTFPRITRDSRWVLYTTGVPGGQGSMLYRVPITGGEPTRLNLPADQLTQRIDGLAISPDGRRVVYDAYIDASPYGEDLFSTSIDGDPPAVRIDNSRDHRRDFNIYETAFSPDSRWLLYRARLANSSLYGLYVTPTNGSWLAQRLSAPVELVGGFVTTPDSRHVIFRGGADNDGPWDLYIADLPPQSVLLTSSGGTIDFGDLQLTFPPNAVATPVTLTYTTFSNPTHALEPGRLAVRSFALTAHDGAGQPVSSFAQPYTLRLSYREAELAALGIDEAGLELAFWDGAAWEAVPPCEGCGVDAATNTITVRLDHMTDFALLGAANESIFLPLIAR